MSTRASEQPPDRRELGSEARAVLHQYMSGRYAAGVAGGEVWMEVTTDYPWNGWVTIRVAAAPTGRWELALRVPHWAEQPTLTVNGTAADTAPTDGWWVVSREWKDGDEQPRTPAGRPHHRHRYRAPKVAPVDGTLGRVATIRIGGRIRPRTGASWWPYSLTGAPARDELGESVALTGVPYYTWGNREPGAMRIWIPTA